jgi:methyl-accepting chemotaxis protein
LDAVLVQPIRNLALLPAGTGYVLGLGTILIGLLAGILAALVANRVVRPLDQATQTVYAIAADSRQARVAVKGQNELSRLGLAINRMANHLDQTVQQQSRLLDQVRQDAFTARQQVIEVQHQLDHLQQDLQAQDEALQQRDREIQQRDATIHQRDDELQRRHAELQQRVQDLQQRDQDIRQRDREIQQRDATLHQRDEALQQRQAEIQRWQRDLQQRDQDAARQAAALDTLLRAMQAVNQGDLDQPIPSEPAIEDIAAAYSTTVDHLRRLVRQVHQVQQTLPQLTEPLQQEIHTLEAVHQQYDPQALLPVTAPLSSMATALRSLHHDLQSVQALATSSMPLYDQADVAAHRDRVLALKQTAISAQQHLQALYPTMQHMSQMSRRLSHLIGQTTLVSFNASLKLARFGDATAAAPLGDTLNKLRSLSQQAAILSRQLSQQVSHLPAAVEPSLSDMQQLEAQVLSDLEATAQLQPTLEKMQQIQQQIVPQLAALANQSADPPDVIADAWQTLQGATAQSDQARSQLEQVTTTLADIMAAAHTLHIEIEPFTVD